MPLDVPPELAYVGGFITALCGVVMVMVAILDRREKGAERRFDEATELYTMALAGEQHARKRLEEVRRERDEWKAKYERGEITIATLREALEHCNARQRALERFIRKNGVIVPDLNDESSTA